jgi:hypothetical protein
MGMFVLESFGLNSPAEGPAEVTGECSSDDRIDLGISLIDLIALTATGTTNYAGVDEAAQTTDSWVAHLQTTLFSGWTNVAYKIQDSADGAAWADLAGGTFSVVTGPFEQRLEGTGTVRRHVRAVATPTGASGSITSNMSFARRSAAYGSAGTHRHLCGLYGRAATSTFEYGPEGSAAGALKQSGECRLQDLEISFPVDDDASFSGTLVIDGAITDGVWP